MQPQRFLPRWIARPRFATHLHAVAAFCMVSACGAPESEDRSAPIVPEGSNLLVVTIDTLRADRLSSYGYAENRTPSIDRLAREGVLFRQAFTPVPLTLPAHSSLFTGLLPYSHGVRDNGSDHLSQAIDTLAEVFKAHRYETAAFVSAFVLDAKWGIAQGFDHFYDDFTVVAAERVAMAAIQRPAGEVWGEARGWLSSRANQRFFVWLHFFDPHSPYEPPEPFKTRHPDSPYDGEVAYVDSTLADVLSHLETLELLEKTVILLVGDHGEGLGDHEEDEHGLFVYDSTLHVPWIMRFPNRYAAGVEIGQAVSLVDVFPTLVELFGFPVPPRLDGLSRVGLLGGRNAPEEQALYAESLRPRLRFGWSELASVRTERFKYIRAPRPELYEYPVDTEEANNLAERHPDVVARLDEILTGMMEMPSEHAVSSPQLSDPQMERQLRALGYLGGGTNTDVDVPGLDLPDPKDKARSYGKVLEARKLLQGGDERGVELLKDLVRAESDLEEAHRLLRDYWIVEGRFEAAVAFFRAEIAREPGRPLLWIDLGVVYRAWKRPQEASDALRRALSLEPTNVEALTSLGEVLGEQGYHDEAYQQLAQAFEASGQDPSLLVRMAQMEIYRRRPVEADKLLRKALRYNEHVSGAHYLLALLAEQRGDLVYAEAEYRRELEVNPWDHQSLFNLALLLGRRKAHAEQIALLDSIPPIAPEFHEVHFYRAKAYLDSGEPARLADAIAAAEEGLRSAPGSTSAPLGHYVLADAYRLLGRHGDAARELRRGQELESNPGRR